MSELKQETAGQMYTRLGVDGCLWAKEMHEAFPTVSESDLIGWCCNMIMAGYDKGRSTPDTSAKVDVEALEEAIKLTLAKNGRYKEDDGENVTIIFDYGAIAQDIIAALQAPRSEASELKVAYPGDILPAGARLQYLTPDGGLAYIPPKDDTSAVEDNWCVSPAMSALPEIASKNTERLVQLEVVELVKRLRQGLRESYHEKQDKSVRDSIVEKLNEAEQWLKINYFDQQQ